MVLKSSGSSLEEEKNIWAKISRFDTILLKQKSSRFNSDFILGFSIPAPEALYFDHKGSFSK